MMGINGTFCMCLRLLFHETVTKRALCVDFFLFFLSRQLLVHAGLDARDAGEDGDEIGLRLVAHAL